MKRAPIVLAGTAAGLAGILGYHIAPSSTSGSATAATAATSAAAASSSTSSTATTTTSAQKTAAKKTATAKSKTTSSSVRSATGEDVSFQYGDLEVKVTKSGSRITNVTVVRFDVSDMHSQQIDDVAVPELRSEAIAAQSAKIDGVSGASYTSAAYEQSLQSALDKLA